MGASHQQIPLFLGTHCVVCWIFSVC